MEIAAAVAAAPAAIPLPPPPSNDFMTDAAWDVFFALLDGALPSIAPSSKIQDKDGQISIPDEELQRIIDSTLSTIDDPVSAQDVLEFLSHRPSQDPDFREDSLRTLSFSPGRAKLGKMMNLLTTRAGSLIFTGYWTPVHQQPAHVRQAIIQSWSTSRFMLLRMMAKTMCVLASKTNNATNPRFESLLGYSPVPRDWKPVDGYDFNFIQLEPGTDAHEITTDVVIVGSGPGGGVSAKNLAEAGHKVLVVDKGYYFRPSQLPMTARTAPVYLYDNGGGIQSDNSSIGCLFGSSWGGGGTVNWSVCFKLQDYVREEWAEGGLPFFTSRDFDECMDRVWNFIGAGTDAIRHNHRNNIMLDGTKKLGWHGATCNQNTANKEHYCGSCHYGCGLGEKRGPAVAWLPAAAEAGAEFMEGFEVERVLFGEDGVTAIGVEGLWTGRDADGGVHTAVSDRTQRRVVIKAKRVIISAGTMWTPLILKRSGIENPQIGQNLHLHPVNHITSIHREETNPWEGGIITSYSSEFENLDGKGHGVKLEPVAMIPAVFGITQPWTSGLDTKLLALRSRHAAGFIALARDRDTGRVYPDPVTGGPRVDYTPSDFDREHILEGIQAMAKICYVSGATEIRATYPGLQAFTPDPAVQDKVTEGQDPEFTDPAFAKWLKQMRDIDNKPPVTIFSSAHQMGTCRMSAKEEDGVVDDRGRVWGRKNLYVADASVFPSASGVNPMVTVMSVADWISRCAAKDLSSSD
ncbi:Long-chain-alcohol oxidase FAO3-like protein [Cladobotryum mycophilum]|uniref:Long-chain-alcohol oxidase n=1 Tax=Cladobotryum mycophilum TaxID=491253 RepID=A0ABR0SEU5_9HYPO